MSWLSRTALPERQERALQKALEGLREQRRKRFRILACIDGSDELFLTVRFAARLGKGNECDIILLYVRPIDQGLQSGGLQVRVARQNMLEWGVELPGVKDLKKGLEILPAEGISPEDWSHPPPLMPDAWGDQLGDNKVEYCHENGRVVVLKLKTAPDSGQRHPRPVRARPLQSHDPGRAVALGAASSAPGSMRASSRRW